MKRAVLAATALGTLIAFLSLRQTPTPRPSSQAELPPPTPNRPPSSAAGREPIAGHPSTVLAAAPEFRARQIPKRGGPRAGFSAQTMAKEDLLDDISRSKNDNDPRLDSGFNDLSPETKTIFRLKYRRLPHERFNERGTIVYLLGKNLASPEDWAFLRELVVEPPCLSLTDCTKEDEFAQAREKTGDAVTLAYPALVALKQAQRVLEDAHSGGADRREALAVIRAAKSSRAPIVVQTAVEIDR
ncbi:MAG: hypothetical protein AAB268_09150 [Elusimicrobiota bacterium]